PGGDAVGTPPVPPRGDAACGGLGGARTGSTGRPPRRRVRGAGGRGEGGGTAAGGGARAHPRGARAPSAGAAGPRLAPGAAGLAGGSGRRLSGQGGTAWVRFELTKGFRPWRF